MVTKLYNHNTYYTPITLHCSLHASIAQYITHISFTYTVTSLTSTIISRSMNSYLILQD